eukprot:TRINITY_DN17841_c1_g1_i1.p1 TRINITY_DN17841_c1_g1~~TRINITY_DN17841_c1_g1_i1.p1  ORF type:complete len:122 (+),score=2.03 TRINITY_DN17841_c1_g1_i1:629-994(+)
MPTRIIWDDIILILLENFSYFLYHKCPLFFKEVLVHVWCRVIRMEKTPENPALSSATCLVQVMSAEESGPFILVWTHVATEEEPISLSSSMDTAQTTPNGNYQLKSTTYASRISRIIHVIW